MPDPPERCATTAPEWSAVTAVLLAGSTGAPVVTALALTVSVFGGLLVAGAVLLKLVLRWSA